MSIINPEIMGKDGFTPVEFSPIRQVRADKLGRLLGKIRASVQHGRPTFIPKLVRQGGQEVIDQGVELITELFEEAHDMPFGVTANHGLHTDKAPGSIGLTMHHTKVGQAEAVILYGARLSPMVGMSSKDKTLAIQCAADTIFGASALDAELLLKNPDVAFKTSLEAGDVLFFDDSQPHAFRSLTGDRSSTAYWSDRTASK